MEKLIQKQYIFEDYINNYMIYCVNKELLKKRLKSYESCLKLFAKYLKG